MDNERKKTNSSSLVLWRMLQFASERSRLFDFVGSMKPGIEKFNREFGAKQVPYNYIMRMSPVAQLGLRLMRKL
jgi:hypothetical protein